MSSGEKVYDHPHSVSLDGSRYRVSVFGSRRGDGTWSGWLEFRDVKTDEKLTTGQETSQPDRKALEYWASGIEDVYLEGALERAKIAR